MSTIEGHLRVEPPANVAIWNVDPYSESVLSNPAPFYEELRAKGAFAFLPALSILATGRHAVIQEVLARPERFVSSRGTGIVDYKVQANWRKPSIILEVDPPYHTKTRGAMLRTMTPPVVASLKPVFQGVADSTVDALLNREFDAVPDLAEFYSITVFPPAVGLRNVDRRKIIDYGIMTFNANGPNNALTREWMEKGKDTVPWVTEACKRENLLPGGFGEAIFKQLDAGLITDEEAPMLVRAFIAAGMDATIAAIGTAVWSLATNPGEFERLKQNPELARSALDEALRLNSPVQHFYRTCIEDTEVAGVTVPADTKVMLSYASANLDPEHWPEPNRYDIGRKLAGQMTFGTGLHACVGQMVARAEGEAVLIALANKVDRIELTGPAEWRPNNFVRSLRHLPLRFAGK